MKDGIIIAGKQLTKETVEKLEETLGKENTEPLKKQMEKLFTFKNIYNMHDEHLIELAECIVDLWQCEDKTEWALETEKYLKSMMSRYRLRKKERYHKIQWAKVTKNADELAMLDLAYRLWVYECGFEYSHFQMYNMLYQITQNILRHKEEGMI